MIVDGKFPRIVRQILEDTSSLDHWCPHQIERQQDILHCEQTVVIVLHLP